MHVGGARDAQAAVPRGGCDPVHDVEEGGRAAVLLGSLILALLLFNGSLSVTVLCIVGLCTEHIFSDQIGSRILIDTRFASRNHTNES